MEHAMAAYFCKCGQIAQCRDNTTGERLCIKCAIEAMSALLKQGEHVAVSLRGKVIGGMILVPGDDGKGDLLAPQELIEIDFCRN